MEVNFVRKDWDSLIDRVKSLHFNIYQKNWRKNFIQEGEVITQNALPSKWVSIEGDSVGMVSHDYTQSFVLFGEFEALGDGIVESNCLV